MRIRKHNVGQQRWHISAFVNGGREKEEFLAWIRENMPDCFCTYREGLLYDPDNSRYFELRGTDHGQMMMIVMRWMT